MGVLRANYAQIEGAYYQINIAEISFRRLLNLVLAYLSKNCDEKTWNDVFDDAFKYDPVTQARMDARRPDIRPAEGDKRATIVIPKPEKVVKYGEDASGLVVD